MQHAENILLPLLPRGRVDNILYGAQIGLRESPLHPEQLRVILANQSLAGNRVVFPSHLFEYEHLNQALEWLEEFSLPFYVQISPGAELREYLPQIQALQERETLLLRLELVMDRAPHEGDWEILHRLRQSGVTIRYVYCPVREFQAFGVLEKIPASIFSDLYFYFPLKRNSRDSFFSADEIFIFTEKLKKKFPEFPLRILQHLPNAEGGIFFLEAKDKTAFRHDPQVAGYITSYSNTGSFFRRPLLSLVRSKVTEPVLAIPHFLLWFFDDPLPAIRNFFLKLYHLARVYLYYKCLLKVYYALRWLANSLYYQVLLRAYFFAYHVLVVLYFFLRAPAWTVKEKVPWVYWGLIFPWFKLYWFVRFQFKKRILKRNGEEA